MRLNVTIDVPDVALRAATSPSARAFGMHASAPVVEPRGFDAGDRIERGAAPDGTGFLATLAARAPLGGARRVRYVHHGALRVPVAADGAFTQAVRYLSRDATMRGIIARVERSHSEYTLRIVHHDDDAYDGARRTIDWDPHSALRTSGGGRQSPALGLGHELDHAAAPWRARCAGEARAVAGYDNFEERRVIRGSETHAARMLGEAVRTDHRGSCYKVASPIAV